MAMSQLSPKAEQTPAATSAQPPYAASADVGPVTAPVSPPSLAAAGPVGEAPASLSEETDVWWGSYAGRSMTPSWAVCVLLTGLIIGGAWALVPRTFLQATILGVAGAVWLVQGLRWGYRLFGYNYRLTTRRMYCDRGFLYNGFASMDLTDIASVEVKRTWLDRLLGVGRVWLVARERARPPLVLDSVRRPLVVAKKIRALAAAVSKN
jgi:hypothetical protein